jgi:hypothetical protein
MPTFHYFVGEAKPCKAFPKGHGIGTAYLPVSLETQHGCSGEIPAIVDTGF